jgi:hypothetical protein
MQDVNRLKLVLADQKKASKWLSEEFYGPSVAQTEREYYI